MKSRMKLAEGREPVVRKDGSRVTRAEFDPAGMPTGGIYQKVIRAISGALAKWERYDRNSPVVFALGDKSLIESRHPSTRIPFSRLVRLSSLFPRVLPRQL